MPQGFRKFKCETKLLIMNICQRLQKKKNVYGVKKSNHIQSFKKIKKKICLYCLSLQYKVGKFVIHWD